MCVCVCVCVCVCECVRGGRVPVQMVENGDQEVLVELKGIRELEGKRKR